MREKGIGLHSTARWHGAFCVLTDFSRERRPRPLKKALLHKRPLAARIPPMEMNSHMEPTAQPKAPGPRHSILDLAPLELECLSVLWPLGEGTVRDIHRALAASRPRAYTTVLTIM